MDTSNVEKTFSNQRFLQFITLFVCATFLFASTPARTEDLVIKGQDGWLFPVWESLTDASKPRIDANLVIIGAVRKHLAEKNIQLLTLVVPMKASFYPDRMPPTKPISAEVMNRYAYVMAGLCAAGIRTVNVANVLRAQEKDGQHAFFRTDYHWTAQAAEASAVATAEQIRQQVHFDKEPAGGSELGEWVNTRLYGDLAVRYMSAEQRVLLKRDVFRVREQPKQSMSLLDDDLAEVHVVGNSFVQPYLGFPQKLSETLNRPVSLTWKFGNVGPWATMLQYLESDEFLQNKPKVILWQLNEPRMHSGPDAVNVWDTESLMKAEVWLSRVVAAISR